MRTSTLSFVLFYILVLVGAVNLAANQQKTITITGNLLQVVGIGGESTGWAIRLDSEMDIEGKKVNSIEVSAKSQDLAKLEHKHVEANGTLTVRHGVERGEWTVLEISTIRVVARNK